jgi:RNA polymerase sigma-70 factor (ECF subfamily)
VQETYLRAFQAYGRQPVRDVRAWLITICLNVARNEQRRHSRHPEELVEPGVIGDVATESPASSMNRARTEFTSEPAGLAELADQRRAVRRALTQLPEPQRACIVLVDMVGYSAQEAADLLGCPRGTVMARVHRGRRRLAVLLESEGVNHEL